MPKKRKAVLIMSLTRNDVLPQIDADLSVQPQTNSASVPIPIATGGVVAGSGLDVTVTVAGMSSQGNPIFANGEYVYQGRAPGTPPQLISATRHIKDQFDRGFLVNLIDANGDLQISWHDSELVGVHDIHVTVNRILVSNV
jgi:hypothetical protein